MKTTVLFSAAAAAKSFGDMQAANKLWAFLFEGALRGGLHHRGISFRYERGDEGDYWSSSQHDLVVLVDRKRGQTLSIPVNILAGAAVARMFRTGQVVVVERKRSVSSWATGGGDYRRVVAQLAHRTPGGILADEPLRTPKGLPPATPFQAALADYKTRKQYAAATEAVRKDQEGRLPSRPGIKPPLRRK